MNTELLTRLQNIIAEENLGYSERFERRAKEFYRATGFMPPGKSVPMEMTISEDARNVVWESWNAQRTKQFYDDLRQCVVMFDEIDNLESEVQDLQDQLTEAETDNHELRTEIRELESDLLETRERNGS